MVLWDTAAKARKIPSKTLAIIGYVGLEGFLLPLFSLSVSWLLIEGSLEREKLFVILPFITFLWICVFLGKETIERMKVSARRGKEEEHFQGAVRAARHLVSGLGDYSEEDLYDLRALADLRQEDIRDDNQARLAFSIQILDEDKRRRESITVRSEFS